MSSRATSIGYKTGLLFTFCSKPYNCNATAATRMEVHSRGLHVGQTLDSVRLWRPLIILGFIDRFRVIPKSMSESRLGRYPVSMKLTKSLREIDPDSNSNRYIDG